MPIKSFFVSITLILSIIFTGCGSRKKIVYFQDDKSGLLESVDRHFVPVFEIGDIISIEVTGTDPEVAAVYNQAEFVRQGNQMGSYENGIPATYGYVIAPDSTVSMPIIGKVKVGGLNRDDAVNELESIMTAYLEKPKVSIRMLNFKVTVLGEVNNPGTFNIPNQRITILEALGIAKDLKITGERRNLLVIRHENGFKKEYRIDLTKKELFDSPVYYLKQNDVIYVEPNVKSRYDASVLRTTGGVIISVTSLIITTIVLISK